MHKDRREQAIKGTGPSTKTAVMGLLERKAENGSSRVKARVVPHRQRATLQAEVREHVEPGSRVLTDALAAYRDLSDEYIHETVDYAIEHVTRHHSCQRP
jgi:hypothetical protein